MVDMGGNILFGLKRALGLVFLLLIIAVSSCSKKGGSTPAPDITLKSVAPFPVGAAINPWLLKSNLAYFDRVATEYNSVTTENVLKFNFVEPRQNQFDFSMGDTILRFAKAQHMRVHGHNLIWHNALALPDWVINFSGDNAAWEAMFKNHIETEVAHYKGQITSWDVVNEALRDDNGAIRNLDVNPGDGSIWRRHLGPDYIARAFQYAHEADPNALLFYNDYGQEWNSVKVDSMIALVTGLKTRGIPISGIGMQCHIDINMSQANFKIALQKLVATGLLIHISELDISVNPGNDPNISYNYALQLQQSNMYQFVVQTYKNTVPKAQQYGITTWNVGDADSWIPGFFRRKDWPLPFDSLYRPKNCYNGYLNGLKN